MKTASVEFLLEQNWLAMEFWGRKLLFNVTFKSHLFWHMADQSQFVNPRSGWTYGEEDYVGKIARIFT